MLSLFLSSSLSRHSFFFSTSYLSISAQPSACLFIYFTSAFLSSPSSFLSLFVLLVLVPLLPLFLLLFLVSVWRIRISLSEAIVPLSGAPKTRARVRSTHTACGHANSCTAPAPFDSRTNRRHVINAWALWRTSSQSPRRSRVRRTGKQTYLMTWHRTRQSRPPPPPTLTHTLPLPSPQSYKLNDSSSLKWACHDLDAAFLFLPSWETCRDLYIYSPCSWWWTRG